MPTRSLYDQVAEILGSSLSTSESKFLELLRYKSEYETADDEDGRAEVATDAATVVQAHRECFNQSLPIVEGAEALAGLRDGRWGLLSDLRRAYAAEDGRPEYEPPKHLSIGRGLDMSSRPTADTLIITVDRGIPLQTLIRTVRALWPQMRDAGYVRATRTMAPRAVKLVRFVCLEQPVGTTWRERLATWNTLVPAEWAYDDVRAFQKDFKRAETSIAGEPDGLGWFYDAAERELSGVMGQNDIAGLSPEAKRKLDRRLRQFVGGLSHLGALASPDDRKPE